MLVFQISIAGIAALALWLLMRALRRKNVDIIIRGDWGRERSQFDGTRHVFFCFVDHFEPLWKRPGMERGLERVRKWHERYPKAIDGFRDNSGRPPQHTFFYPQEEYIPECLEMLADLSRRGYGDVEIHLHHDRDTSEGFRQKIIDFKKILHNEHGLLHKNDSGRIEYAFIHGNWALDDSRKDGRWCGVRDEITILKETGCYADYTFPSAPNQTQPPIINRIYYATDDPLRPKSHHQGVEARFNSPPQGDLLLINGPLSLNWSRRKWGFMPGIENGQVTGARPPSADRVDLWVKVGISVRQWPSWIFVKVYTHGAQESNSGPFLNGALTPMHSHLLQVYNDGEEYVLHYVTAREMYLCVKALESGNINLIRHIESFDYPKP